MDKPTEKEAYDIMEQLEITFTRIDHEPITSVKNYNAELPGPQVKNLILKNKKGKEFFHIILPDEKSADLKTLASQLETTRLSFASADELLELLGLTPGSVTPFALHHDKEGKIQVVIDADIDHEDTVGFHPNINTTTLIIQFHDLEKYLEWACHPPRYIKL